MVRRIEPTEVPIALGAAQRRAKTVRETQLLRTTNDHSQRIYMSTPGERHKTEYKTTHVGSFSFLRCVTHHTHHTLMSVTHLHRDALQ